MKNKASKISILIATFFILTSCSADLFNSVTGNRNVLKQVRKTSENFTGIKVSSGIDLYITQGSRNNIIIEADENLHDIIKTEIDDDVLKIYTEKNIWRSKAKKVFVTIQDLQFIKASSGSDVKNDESITVDNILISASSGANVNLQLVAKTVETNASSGADIKLTGTSISHDSNASSGAAINSFKLESTMGAARASSGANIKIYASKTVKANASSGGNINVKGMPQEIDKNTSSGGNISIN